MGSSASLKIKDYEFLYMQSYVDPFIMSLFTEDNKFIEIEKDSDGEYRKIQYKTNVKIVKTRLNIMGFNLKKAEYIFKLSKNQNIENFDYGDFDINKKQEFKNLLKSFTFDKYLLTLKKIYENKIDLFYDTYSGQEKKVEKIKKEDFYVKYVLEDEENSDYIFYLRSLLEKLNDDIQIFIDVSEIINAGYYEEKDKIAELSLNKEHKTIIFTEGKYDTFVIKESMELLYPAYVQYFSFLDIELSNLELGANRIITYLKSFISAGIVNKVLVLFDNDSEGCFCKQELLKLKKIPDNFCIKTYPDIKIAENYPTICPTGIENLNVNGSACSIELYLCEESIKENSQLISIQWKSFNDKINKYQGGFSNKNKGAIQKKYENILKSCKRDKNCINKHSFNNMKTLLQSIFTAFDDKII